VVHRKTRDLQLEASTVKTRQKLFDAETLGGSSILFR
jgi:hypothetical protein